MCAENPIAVERLVLYIDQSVYKGDHPKHPDERIDCMVLDLAGRYEV